MPTLQDKEDSLMKLNSKRIDFEYTPDEEIFTFPEDTGLPFLFAGACQCLAACGNGGVPLGHPLADGA